MAQYVSILKRLATQLSDIRWGFKTPSDEFRKHGFWRQSMAKHVSCVKIIFVAGKRLGSRLIGLK
jgi:hypothetical protein